MSTLTKVFVILLVVFSIAFTTMTVSIVAQTTNWKDAAGKFEEHARVADTNLRNLIASGAAELATAQDAISAHHMRIADLERQLQDSRSKAGECSAEIAKVSAEKSSAIASSGALLAQLKVSEDARNEYKKQRDDLETRSGDLQRRNVDLNDRVNEQTARIVVLQEQKRQLEQQINLLREENESLANLTRRPALGNAMEDAGSTAAGKNITPLSPVAASPIRGRIVNINGGIITVSVGAADGVKKDMTFVIYRGGDYIGDLRIDVIDPNQAAGRISKRTADPQVGDTISDAALFAGSRG